eukprot:4822910-Pleurochrysis_carterae.AAC.3
MCSPVTQNVLRATLQIVFVMLRLRGAATNFLLRSSRGLEMIDLTPRDEYTLTCSGSQRAW